MKKMFVTASLVAVAACGNIRDPNGDTKACDTAADCASGEACDLDQHVCVMGALTIDPTGFAVDGTRWWTTSSAPVVKGTYQGTATATVQIEINGQVTQATLDGSTWTAKLAADSIATTDTEIKVSMTDPAGAHVELVQVFAVDNAAPAIQLMTSRVHDERGDTIDFSAGEPVHTHAGAEIDLATEQCPAIYKYAYLMDADSPAFGRQAAQNPLAWNFAIRDAKTDAVAYRVRTPNNEVLLDWTDVPVDGSGAYAIELHRAGQLPQLGTYEGQLFLDVRARDWAGYESSSTACWEHHPLAAPLSFEPIQAAGGASALSSWSLLANSPISRLAYIAGGAQVAVQRVTQYTAEPVVLNVLARGAGTGWTYGKTIVDGYVPISSGTCASGACGDTQPPPAPTVTSTTGTFGAHNIEALVLDETTGTLVFSPIPGRGANEPPHSYLIVTSVTGLFDLIPDMTGEYTVAGLTYTGKAPGTTLSVCTSWFTKCFNGECYDVCRTTTVYQPIHAVDALRIDLPAVQHDVTVSPAASIAPTTPSYVPVESWALPATTWNAGDDDLPGPY